VHFTYFNPFLRVKKETQKIKRKTYMKNEKEKPVLEKVSPATELKNELKEIAESNQEKPARLTDEELCEFKELILRKIEEAKTSYEQLKNFLTLYDDHGTNDTSPTFKLMEDAADVSTREETAELALRQGKFIQHLQNALIRIENKTYGICMISGKLIPKERLRSVPHATVNIDAKKDRLHL
jgi:DnaK suppressor protein